MTSGLTIAEVHTHLLCHQLEIPFESAASRFDSREHVLVEIICEDGTTGWGECLGPAQLNAAVVAAYRKMLIGQNALQTEKIWASCYHALRDQGQRGLTVTALSGIDIALWDIKGKRFEVPVSTLLGGRFHDSVTAYATGSFKRDGVDRIADNAREVAAHRAAGFQAAKIKIGFDVEEDLAVIAAVREAMGPDMRLMIDANHGYDVVDAVRLGQRAAEFGIDWFEEPVVPEQLSAYGEVRARQPIPVAGGETWHTRWGFAAPIARHLVDIAQPDICGVGGFTEARRVADLAALHGVRLVPHVWGTGVQIAAALQFISAQVPSPLRPNPVAPLLEFDRTDNPFRQAVLTEPLDHVNGIVAVPEGPGLGIDINRETLRAFAPPA